jgi:hypothetical protein
VEVQYPIPDLDDIDYSVDNNVRGADENVLYKIMDRKGKMISEKMNFRPVHGIHMRTGSHPFGKKRLYRPKHSFEEISNENQSNPWTGIEVEDYRDTFIEILADDQFQRLYFQLNLEVKNMLIVLENACMERFGQFEEEAFTYIITEAYYERVIREGFRMAYSEGIIPTVKKTVKYLQSQINK